MKKAIKLFIPLAIVGLILFTSIARGDYQVSVGQTFTYNVVKSRWSLKQGANVGSGTGYPVEDASFQEGTSFSVEVTDVAPASYVSWEMTAGTKSETGTSTAFDLLGIYLYCFYPFLYTSLFIWDQDEVERGPFILPMFFFDTADAVTFDFFRMLADTDTMASVTTASGFAIDQMEGHFDETGSVAVFDWILDGKIYTTADNTDFDGVERFKVAFDKSTGVLKGYRIDISFSGSSGGQVMEMDLEQHVEQVGYTLGGFYYKAGGFIPGFGWLIGAAAIATMAVTVILLRKRK